MNSPTFPNLTSSASIKLPSITPRANPNSSPTSELGFDTGHKKEAKSGSIRRTENKQSRKESRKSAKNKKPGSFTEMPLGKASEVETLKCPELRQAKASQAKAHMEQDKVKCKSKFWLEGVLARAKSEEVDVLSGDDSSEDEEIRCTP